MAQAGPRIPPAGATTRSPGMPYRPGSRSHPCDWPVAAASLPTFPLQTPQAAGPAVGLTIRFKPRLAGAAAALNLVFRSSRPRTPSLGSTAVTACRPVPPEPILRVVGRYSADQFDPRLALGPDARSPAWPGPPSREPAVEAIARHAGAQARNKRHFPHRVKPRSRPMFHVKHATQTNKRLAIHRLN